MSQSSPPPLPPAEPAPDSRELSQGWQDLLSQGVLAVLLASLVALVWSTGDRWDRAVDTVMYGVLNGSLLLA
ncbi:MAG: hypothetical protein Q4C67_07275, partial [Deinococcus sp.]|nr:hypothetical protein [Deinococcus sp.]